MSVRTLRIRHIEPRKAVREGSGRVLPAMSRLAPTQHGPTARLRRAACTHRRLSPRCRVQLHLKNDHCQAMNGQPAGGKKHRREDS